MKYAWYGFDHNSLNNGLYDYYSPALKSHRPLVHREPIRIVLKLLPRLKMHDRFLSSCLNIKITRNVYRLQKVRKRVKCSHEPYNSFPPKITRFQLFLMVLWAIEVEFYHITPAKNKTLMAHNSLNMRDMVLVITRSIMDCRTSIAPHWKAIAP